MSENRTFTVCRASAGTGKTFTLASRYIALLMGSDRDNLYRNILAVTFTNKATAEMKRRILSYLFIIAEGDEKDAGRRSFVDNVRRHISCYAQSKKALSAEELRAKAGRIYHKILADYDNMRVVTIDSFLQSLISGMAHSVGLGASFGVVLDSSQIVSEAVEELMTTHISDYEGAEAALISFVEEQLDEEKTWDIRKKIISLAGEIMKEAVQKDDDDIVFEADKINAYKKNLKKHYDTKLGGIKRLYNKVKNCEVDKEIKSGSNYYSFIRRIGASIDNTAASKDFFRCLGQKNSDALENDKFLSKISGSVERAMEIRSVLKELNEACQTMYQEWLLYKITAEHLNALMLMGFLKRRIDYKLNELNSILLGRTAYVLSKALKPGDADFILEKAGIRFRHIMIDEFQDTSVLQWEVFKELVGEILSSGGTMLVVGDVKQSIYRWRNGDYTIMENFSESTPDIGRFFDIDAERLSRNFRSRANVVKFNLRVFDRLSKGFASGYETLYKEDSRGYSDSRLGDFYDKERKWGGFVSYRVYPCLMGLRSADTNDNQKTIKEKLVRKTIARQVFADISELIDKGASASDVLILIRYSREVDVLVEAYNESGLSERGVLFSSNDSFRLETSLSVQIVVNVLKHLFTCDYIASEFLLAHGVDDNMLRNCNRQMPLYELVEQIVADVLSDDKGRLVYADGDYLNCFLDNLRLYINTHGTNIDDFLLYWADKLHGVAVPSVEGVGVRIMTIHSSKGLQAKHLFIPFCSWPLNEKKGKLWIEAKKLSDTHGNFENLRLIPVDYQNKLEECDDYREYYERERQANLVDNINLLYVALTRAADNLFVYSPLLYSCDASDYQPETVGDLLFDCMKKEQVGQSGSLVEKFKGEWNLCEADKPPVAEYLLGEEPHLGLSDDKLQEKKETNVSPFEFKYGKDDDVEYSYYSATDVISFRQSQESMLYAPEADDDTLEMQRRINAGVLRHNILYEIQTSRDCDKVIGKYLSKGLIETTSEAREIKEELERAWSKWPIMADWFSGRWQLLREVSILLPDGKGGVGELRPDRVMVSDNKAVVLDYKFGKHNHLAYSKQVGRYMKVLTDMGYSDVEGYLWYGFDNELVKV